MQGLQSTIKRGKMKAVIDRVEGELAVVLIGEKGEFKLNIPLSLLPEGSRESDILNISIERDSFETQQVKKKCLRING